MTHLKSGRHRPPLAATVLGSLVMTGSLLGVVAAMDQIIDGHGVPVTASVVSAVVFALVCVGARRARPSAVRMVFIVVSAMCTLGSIGLAVISVPPGGKTTAPRDGVAHTATGQTASSPAASPTPGAPLGPGNGPTSQGGNDAGGHPTGSPSSGADQGRNGPSAGGPQSTSAASPPTQMVVGSPAITITVNHGGPTDTFFITGTNWKPQRQINILIDKKVLSHYPGYTNGGTTFTTRFDPACTNDASGQLSLGAHTVTAVTGGSHFGEQSSADVTYTVDG